MYKKKSFTSIRSSATSPERDAASPAGDAVFPEGDLLASPNFGICDTTQNDRFIEIGLIQYEY
jgi:hypothetical protein